MKFLFLDDSKQRNSSRPRLGEMLSVGGVIVDSQSIRALDTKIEDICKTDFGFPESEVFKWSPSKDHWFRASVTGDRRNEFFKSVLRACLDFDAKFVVCTVDVSKGQANPKASSHEIDALTLTLERFNTFISPSGSGVVLLAKPSGGQRDENKILAEMIDVRSSGTEFVNFSKMALNIITVPYNHSRILQVADLVVSVTTAMVSGETKYAAEIFPDLLKGFHRNSKGQVGGAGLKLHPSTLNNLYFWLCDDRYYVRGNSGIPLPKVGSPFDLSDRIW